MSTKMIFVLSVATSVVATMISTVGFWAAGFHPIMGQLVSTPAALIIGVMAGRAAAVKNFK